MKSIFNFIFPKNTKSTFQKSYAYQSKSHQVDNLSKAKNAETKISIFDKIPMQNSYEVAEISFDEFKNSRNIERRKLPRKSLSK